MGYYCPLHDAKGNTLVLSQIQYRHFSQLAETDEGYKVEYKSAWDDDLRKKHLAKVITSFANTEGGWLFIGVDNRGLPSDIDKTRRTDYAQTIGQIIKAKVSPSPRFETRFVTNPENKAKGILVVYIHEGDEPPYICQGTVYVRIGSSKEPVLVKNRAEIDNLVEKRNGYEERMGKFSVNELFRDDYKNPYGIIFLYNRSAPLLKMIQLWQEKERAEEFAKEYGFEKWMITNRSVLFYNSAVISVNSVTTVLEMRLDGSIKIYLPFSLIPEQFREGLREGIIKRMRNVDLEGFSAIDGFLVRSIASTMLRNIFRFFIKNKIDTQDYMLSSKLYNIRNCYLFYRTNGKEWSEYMQAEGFKYSCFDSATTPYTVLNELNQKKLDLHVEAYLAHGIFSAFGVAAIDYLTLDNSVISRIKASMGEVQKLSTAEYHQKMFGL